VTRIVWSPQSLRDLEELRAYIAHDSPSMPTSRFVVLLRPSNGLPPFLNPGESSPSAINATFVRLSFEGFSGVCRLRGGDVEIMTVFRGSREFPEQI
jgi:plasmid stabilization system protein ParE